MKNEFQSDLFKAISDLSSKFAPAEQTQANLAEVHKSVSETELRLTNLISSKTANLQQALSADTQNKLDKLTSSLLDKIFHLRVHLSRVKSKQLLKV